jgi:hypothetical protein
VDVSRTSVLLGLGLGLAVGCQGGPRAGSGSDPVGQASFTVDPAERLDLLFMVDDSVGMIGQEELAHQLPALLDELRSLPGGLPDLHAGVITSSLGAGPVQIPTCPPGGEYGHLRAGSRCGVSGDHRFISVPRGGPANLTAELPQALGCLVRVGLLGCAYEHQLAAVALALDESADPDNAGFLRADAHLAIVLLTDEDDCSAPRDSDLFSAALPDQQPSLRCALAGHVCNGAHPPAAAFTAPLSACRAADDGPLLPVASLVEAVRTRKIDPDRQITVAGIFGVPALRRQAQYRIARLAGQLGFDTVCEGRLGSAALGLRLQRYIDSFGPAGLAEDICTDDLAPALARIGKTIAARMTLTCAPPLLDRDPAEPGIQADCQVVARAAGGEETILLPCAPNGPRPCWRVDHEPRCSSSGQVLTVEGREQLLAAQIGARCAVCLRADDLRCR